MWSLDQRSGQQYRVISASSSSSSYSSRRSMEEVWKDISMTSLPHGRPLIPAITIEDPRHYHHHHHHLNHRTISRGMILQDFLAGDLKARAPSSVVVDDGTHLPPSPLATLLPPTMLSLNSGLDVHQQTGSRSSNSNSDGAGPNVDCQHPACTNSDIGFADVVVIGEPPSPAGLFSFCPQKKRGQETAGIATVDRRHKRMIKNRESAARSRARKQAYTNELELEVSHLLEENARLRKQHEELRLAMAAQPPGNNTLQRTLTAPF